MFLFFWFKNKKQVKTKYFMLCQFHKMHGKKNIWNCSLKIIINNFSLLENYRLKNVVLFSVIHQFHFCNYSYQLLK